MPIGLKTSDMTTDDGGTHPKTLDVLKICADVFIEMGDAIYVNGMPMEGFCVRLSPSVRLLLNCSNT
jgi:hypothetical protein